MRALASRRSATSRISVTIPTEPSATPAPSRTPATTSENQCASQVHPRERHHERERDRGELPPPARRAGRQQHQDQGDGGRGAGDGVAGREREPDRPRRGARAVGRGGRSPSRTPRMQLGRCPRDQPGRERPPPPAGEEPRRDDDAGAGWSRRPPPRTFRNRATDVRTTLRMSSIARKTVRSQSPHERQGGLGGEASGGWRPTATNTKTMAPSSTADQRTLGGGWSAR